MKKKTQFARLHSPTSLICGRYAVLFFYSPSLSVDCDIQQHRDTQSVTALHKSYTVGATVYPVDSFSANVQQKSESQKVDARSGILQKPRIIS